LGLGVFGFWFLDFGFWILVFGFWFLVFGSEFGVWSLGFGVWALGFRVGVYDSVFKQPTPPADNYGRKDDASEARVKALCAPNRIPCCAFHFRPSDDVFALLLLQVPRA
jgi:hypothetical protein